MGLPYVMILLQKTSVNSSCSNKLHTLFQT